MIYIASPYNHPDKDIVQSNYVAAISYAAKLTSEGQVPISPIAYGHNLLDYADMPSDWEFWKHFCHTFLDKCTELHVLTIEGWDKSSGVAGEIERATELGIKIIYVQL